MLHLIFSIVALIKSSHLRREGINWGIASLKLACVQVYGGIVLIDDDCGWVQPTRDSSIIPQAGGPGLHKKNKHVKGKQVSKRPPWLPVSPVTDCDLEA